MELEINPSENIVGQTFRLFIEADTDAGGILVANYIENVRYCIKEKSQKISSYKSRYSTWWLYLVDFIGWTLDTQEIQKLDDSINDIGNFDKVVILENQGRKILFDKH
jgi:hypothetical protein